MPAGRRPTGPRPAPSSGPGPQSHATASSSACVVDDIAFSVSMCAGWQAVTHVASSAEQCSTGRAWRVNKLMGRYQPAKSCGHAVMQEHVGQMLCSD